MTTSRGIPSSRAYWELKADQMMNRIFDPEGPIDLEASAPDPAVPTQPSTAATESAVAVASGPSCRPASLWPAAAASRRRPRAVTPPTSAPGPIRTVRALGRERRAVLLSALGGIGLASLITSLLYVNHANQVQLSLRQERNLLLVERLRSLGPASPAAAPAPQAAMALTAGAEELPPPPDEPWAEQLSQLPRGEAGRPAPLRVSPLPAVVNAPSGRVEPDAGSAAAASASMPQLVGVVGAPGKLGSAIFQVGGSSSSVSAGETIGGSGWRLRSADGDTALIERGGEVRRVAISGGF
ncbi:MAG: hypothetical protein VKI83_06710 [Synechococcaceae cyanobacterium]|nr:hypothetical protein [Synechococcaceae cyanobacterium]